MLGFILLCGLAGCTGKKDKEKLLDFSNINMKELKTYEAGRTSLRGLTASGDGAYLYGGYIKGHPRGVYKIDAQSGEDVWYYQDQGYTKPGFCKGVAVDDRGYVYVGVTLWEQQNEMQLVVLDDETGKEVSLTKVMAAGKLGNNGVTVRKKDDKYLLYLITNYQTNHIYCYDVTDINTPVLYSGFGVEGIVNLPVLAKTESIEGTAIAFDEDGSFYMTANFGNGSKGDSILHISEDGKKILDKTTLNEAYGIDRYGSYLFVSTYMTGTSSVHVLNKEDFAQVAELGNLPDCTQYTGVVFRDGKLYIADQAYQEGSRILVSDIINEKSN